jgi:hypothetical protein
MIITAELIFLPRFAVSVTGTALAPTLTNAEHSGFLQFLNIHKQENKTTASK